MSYMRPISVNVRIKNEQKIVGGNYRFTFKGEPITITTRDVAFQVVNFREIDQYILMDEIERIQIDHYPY